MALTSEIEEIRKRFGLQHEDFWQLPQNKSTWLIKHKALEKVAQQAGVTWGKVTVVEANSEKGIAAMLVVGFMPVPGSEAVVEEWSVGEASPKNCKNAYPWAMAEKRAKDRVTLKLVGIHGTVYSEDEIDDSAKKPVSAAHQKREAASLDDDLADVHTEVALVALRASYRAQAKAEKWKPATLNFVADKFDAKEAELRMTT